MSEIQKNYIKPYEELTFSDDFMFGKTMEDPELCRELLECLLQEPVGVLTKPQRQREIRCSYDGKPIRLDVLSENDRGTIYDAEMQNLNKKSVEALHLSRRSRFYQASIDTDWMYKGDPYWRLPDSKILFICTFDPFKEGLSQYTFRERCEEKQDILLNDGTEKIFYNCMYEGQNLPEVQKNFYEYIRTGKTNDSLTKHIDDAVLTARKKEEWRSMYMKEQAIFMELKAEGIEEGIEKRDREKITTMLQKGKSAEAIADFCDYPLSLVLEIQESLQATK